MNNKFLFLRLDEEILSEIESFSEKLMKENNVKFVGHQSSKKSFMLSYFIDEAIKSLIDYKKKYNTVPVFSLSKEKVNSKLQKRITLSDENFGSIQELRDVFKSRGFSSTNSIIVHTAIYYYFELLRKKYTKAGTKVLTVANQKGGVGKTCFVVNFAHYLALLGYSVCVLDLDVQGNASHSLSDYTFDTALYPLTQMKEYSNEELNLKPLSIIKADASLLRFDELSIDKSCELIKNVVLQLKALEYDYILIDTPPTLGVRLTSSLLLSDYVLAPIELEEYSLSGVGLMIKTISNILRVNPKLKFLGMLPNRVRNTSKRHSQVLKTLKEKYSSFVVDASISSSDVYAKSLSDKIPLYNLRKLSGRKAHENFMGITQKIIGLMK